MPAGFDANAFRLDGTVAIVTGAAAGIGRAIAELFASAGAAVVVSDLDGDAAAVVAESIRSAGGNAAATACDVTNESDLVGLADLAVAEFGGVDVLVNNAGGGGPKPFDMPMSDFEWAYRLNVFSAFRLTQLCADQDGLLLILEGRRQPPDPQYRLRPTTSPTPPCSCAHRLPRGSADRYSPSAAVESRNWIRPIPQENNDFRSIR